MRRFHSLLLLLFVCSVASAAKRKKPEASPSESLDIELPKQWNEHTKVDPLAPAPDETMNVEAWIGLYASRDVMADPSPEPVYTSGWVKNGGLMYLFHPEIYSWPAWLGIRVGLSFGWVDRNRGVTVERASYARDQKAYVLGVPLGIEGEFFTSGAWAGSAAVELGAQWVFRPASDTAGGGERVLGWNAALRPMIEYRFKDSGIASVLLALRLMRDSWPEESSSSAALELGARF